MLVNTKEMLLEAYQKGYALPSPDFVDLNMMRAYVEVAEELNVPALLAISEGLSSCFPIDEAFVIGKYLAERASVPVALHIDHGKNVDFVKKAIDIGYTSVMIDGSADPFDLNVQKTREIVEYAHKHNVTVEAEIGHVGSGINYEEDSGPGDTAVYTEVEDLVRFVELTNVDSVAVSVGTAHGLYIGTPKINYERLEQLHQAVNIPLVLHGGSSTGDENLRNCCGKGVAKINIFTDISRAAAKAIKDGNYDNYRDMILGGRPAMKEVLSHYYSVFKCLER